jgi:hypothetical protein
LFGSGNCSRFRDQVVQAGHGIVAFFKPLAGIEERVPKLQLIFRLRHDDDPYLIIPGSL